jgi:hypothetical protein
MRMVWNLNQILRFFKKYPALVVQGIRGHIAALLAPVKTTPNVATGTSTLNFQGRFYPDIMDEVG